MAGGCGGTLKTGRHVQLPDGTPHNDLLVTIAQAMGVDIKTFGNPKYCNGPLAALRTT